MTMRLCSVYFLSLVVYSVGRSILLNEPQVLHSAGHEDAPSLHLMQESHGMYSAAVAPGGDVEKEVPRAEHGKGGEAVVSFNADLTPSDFAFDDAEAEDIGESMHLLQASRDVTLDAMPLKKAEDVISAQVNESLLQANDTLNSAVHLLEEVKSISQVHAGVSRDEEAGTIILGPQDARDSTVVIDKEKDKGKHNSTATLETAVAKPQMEGNASANAFMQKESTEKASVSSPVKLNLKHSAHPTKARHNEEHILPGLQTGHHVHRLHLKSPLHAASALRARGLQAPVLDTVFAFVVLGFLVCVLLVVVVALGKFGKWCLGLYKYSEEKNLRQHVECMRRSPGLEVVNHLIAGNANDSALMRPLASKQLIRLEARVEEAASGFCLWTPLTQQACVRFSATVSQLDKRSGLTIPMSYQCSSIDFVISLLDAPHVRVEIEGRHLSTFDMTAGRMTAKRTFDSAARHWQEFAMSCQIGDKTQPASRFRSDNSVLEFQETAIVLGTRITVIGELHKNAVGTLILRPSIEDTCEVGSEPWRTSWEGISVRNPLTATRKPWLDKVWVSDDPTLLGVIHKHAKYDPVHDFKSKPSRDCSTQFTDGVVNLISPGGM